MQNKDLHCLKNIFIYLSDRLHYIYDELVKKIK